MQKKFSKINNQGFLIITLNQQIKNILKSLEIYHPLQSGYRNFLFKIKREYYRRLFSKYKGKGLECNFCGHQYLKFVDDYPETENQQALSINNVVAGYGKNILCPFCLSTARERLIMATLKSKIEICNKNILHLSPEKNIFNYLKKRSKLVTADLFPGYYKNIDKAIRKENVTLLSFENDYFDLVIANHILEHIPDDAAAMKEIFRVLKKGGVAILQVPYSETITETLETPLIDHPKLQSALYGQRDHVRIYQLNDFINRLMKTGFIVSCLKYEMLKPFYIYAIQTGEVFLEIKKPD